MNDDIYNMLATTGEGLYKEKGSKFIASAFTVMSEDEVKSALAEVKKKYYDARHHDTDIGDILGKNLVKDGFARRARGLAVIGRAENFLVGTNHVGIAMVSCIEIFLLDGYDSLFGFVFAHHDECLGDEFAAFLLVEAFAARG